jgi:hypothetical protein
MRSTAAAALLSICGLCAPLKSGIVRRFDHIFVRGASSDVPTEQKSAFGAEMGDVAALLRCCGEKSLVFVGKFFFLRTFPYMQLVANSNFAQMSSAAVPRHEMELA